MYAYAPVLNSTSVWTCGSACYDPAVGRQDTDNSWLSRNWGWCLGCGCLLPVLVIAGIVTATVWTAKNWIGSNDAIQTAIERLRSDPRAIEALGEPIEPRFWRENTSLNVTLGDDTDDTLETTLGVAGPLGEGRLEIEARQPHGTDGWTLERLLLHLDDRSEPIDLLDQAEPGTSTDSGQRDTGSWPRTHTSVARTHRDTELRAGTFRAISRGIRGVDGGNTGETNHLNNLRPHPLDRFQRNRSRPT